MPRSDSIATRHRVGRYLLQDVIGRGGMGIVHRAYDEHQQRHVALKLLRAGTDDAADARFRNEMQIAVGLEHPHVVPVHEIGTEDGDHYIAMRLVDGEDLGALIRHDGRLDPERAGRIARQIGSALDAAHARGLVHRDVKPGNILLTGSGDEEHAYLTDFGLTRAADSGLTGTGQWIGTVDYAAPEQIEAGALDARTDVYALGCVLYHALTGALPYGGSFTAKAAGHVGRPLPSVALADPLLTGRVDLVLARATAKDPALRYASAGALGRAFERAVRPLDGVDTQATVAMDALVAPVPVPAPTAVAPAPDQVPTTIAPRRARAAAEPPGNVRGSGSRVAALAASALGLAAIVAILTGGDDGSRRSAATAASTGTGKTAAAHRTATARPPVRRIPVPPTTAYTAVTAGFTAQVPSGPGWHVDGEQQLGAVVRTVVTGPGGAQLWIDATPSVAPGFTTAGRTVTGQTTLAGPLGPITRYRFRGSPAFCGGGCVDYQLDLGGHGFAVMAGPTASARLAARLTMFSLRPVATAPAPATTAPAPAAAPPRGKPKGHGKGKRKRG